MPMTREQILADPDFKDLADAEKAKVLVRYPAKSPAPTPAPSPGGGGGEDDWLTSLFNAGGDAVQGVATGAGKQAGRMVVGAGQMVNKALLPGVSDAIQPGALDQAAVSMAPQGVAEKLGAGALHVGSVAGGAAATGGSSLLAQIGAGAAGSGLMEGANSGGDLKSMLMAAATGGAGRALTGARAMGQGVKALGEGGKDAAKARLPELMDEIALAQQKGAVPGHGMVPKVLAQERDSLLKMLAGGADEAATAITEKTGGASIPPWVLKALLAGGGAGVWGVGKRLLKGAME